MDEAKGNGRAGTRGGRDKRDAKSLDSFARLYERPLPYSLEAEMALLGSLILDPRVAPDVITIIRSGTDFYSEAHAAIYAALIEVYDKIPDADLVAVVAVLQDRHQLELIGGPEYLSKLAVETPSAAGATRYAKVVRDRAKLRKLIESADKMIYDALNAGEFGIDGAREIIDAAESSVFEIAQEDDRTDIQPLGDLLDAEIKRIEAAEGKGLSGIPTAFIDLDRMLSGLHPGEMIVLAARPSMGKTALALNIAEQVARGGRTPLEPQIRPDVPVGIFTLEMSKSALVQRLLSAASSIDSQKIRTAHLSEEDLATLRNTAEVLETVPILIDDTGTLPLLTLRARARRMVAQHGVKVIIIDYLQLLSSPGSARESRQVEVSALSRGVKALARELNIPVVCLSQLNRASEDRERPRMSDLRESGSIEQDADVVILLHREDYFHIHDAEWGRANPDKVNVAELIIAKQRNGPTGVVHLSWDPRTTRFRNHSGEHMDSSPFDEPKPMPRAVSGAASRPQGAAAARPQGGFPAGPRTGPVENHRDGGGPERDAEEPNIPY
ncbi:MAG: replicative DNA helicase [Phycisphaerales bacterium]